MTKDFHQLRPIIGFECATPTLDELIRLAKLVRDSDEAVQRMLVDEAFPSNRPQTVRTSPFTRRLACGVILQGVTSSGLDDEVLDGVSLQLRRIGERLRARGADPSTLFDVYDSMFAKFRDACLAVVDLASKEASLEAHLGSCVNTIIHSTIEHPTCGICILQQTMLKLDADARSRVRSRVISAIDLGLGTIEDVDGVSCVECDAVMLKGLFQVGDEFRESALLVRRTVDSCAA